MQDRRANKYNITSYNTKLSAPFALDKILTQYKEVLEGFGHIGCHSFVDVTDPNQKPVQHTPRRISVTMQKEVKDKFTELERKGII